MTRICTKTLLCRKNVRFMIFHLQRDKKLNKNSLILIVDLSFMKACPCDTALTAPINRPVKVNWLSAEICLFLDIVMQWTLIVFPLVDSYRSTLWLETRNLIRMYSERVKQRKSMRRLFADLPGGNCLHK